MPGLMPYLYGPGKANEHTEQHLVAASDDLEFAYAGRLSGGEASELGRVVEASWHEQVAEANALVGAGRGGVSRASFKAGEGAVSDAEKEHVILVVLSCLLVVFGGLLVVLCRLAVMFRCRMSRHRLLQFVRIYCHERRVRVGAPAFSS